MLDDDNPATVSVSVHRSLPTLSMADICSIKTAPPEVSSALGDPAYDKAQLEGGAMSRGQLIAFALDEDAPVIEKPRRPVTTAAQLTNREMQIATLISEGMQTKQIAAKLFISERTVETHVTNILNKLGLSSRL